MSARLSKSSGFFRALDIRDSQILQPQLQTVPPQSPMGGEFGKAASQRCVLYLRAPGFPTLQSAQQYDQIHRA